MEIYPLWAGSTTLLTFYDYLRKYRILYDIYESFSPLSISSSRRARFRNTGGLTMHARVNILFFVYACTYMLLFTFVGILVKDYLEVKGS